MSGKSGRNRFQSEKAYFARAGYVEGEERRADRQERATAYADAHANELNALMEWLCMEADVRVGGSGALYFNIHHHDYGEDWEQMREHLNVSTYGRLNPKTSGDFKKLLATADLPNLVQTFVMHSGAPLASDDIARLIRAAQRFGVDVAHSILGDQLRHFGVDTSTPETLLATAQTVRADMALNQTKPHHTGHDAKPATTDEKAELLRGLIDRCTLAETNKGLRVIVAVDDSGEGVRRGAAWRELQISHGTWAMSLRPLGITFGQAGGKGAGNHSTGLASVLAACNANDVEVEERDGQRFLAKGTLCAKMEALNLNTDLPMNELIEKGNYPKLLKRAAAKDTKFSGTAPNSAAPANPPAIDPTKNEPTGCVQCKQVSASAEPQPPLKAFIDRLAAQYVVDGIAVKPRASLSPRTLAASRPFKVSHLRAIFSDTNMEYKQVSPVLTRGTVPAEPDNQAQARILFERALDHLKVAPDTRAEGLRLYDEACHTLNTHVGGLTSSAVTVRPSKNTTRARQ